MLNGYLMMVLIFLLLLTVRLAVQMCSAIKYYGKMGYSRSNETFDSLCRLRDTLEGIQSIIEKI